MASSIPADVAAADMRRLGKAEPLEPYPGRAREPWMCRHIPCGQIIYPNRNNVMSGQGSCVWCAPNAPKNPEAARSAMLEHGFIVLMDFPGTGKPWLAQCVTAEHVVAPRYDNVIGRNGGCRFCKRHGPGDPLEAVADMRAADFRPLEPFKNIASPWLSVCERCAKTSTPRLNNIRTRGACCRHRARYGLDPGAPARLYILSHSGHGAVKIGITGVRTRENRIARFQGQGWELFAQLPFATGADAYRVEQHVIRHLRAKGHPAFLSDTEMPIGGYKETFDSASVSVEHLLELARVEQQARSENPVVLANLTLVHQAAGRVAP
ncbi:hypothetical protein [Yinghuangia soli]|uniref:Uncharacterized protein n=1 Tax=Yinghuangia soli TaxID=2908204 RepID=A0AA41U6P7_9ACTN|nr:hypothetical protein [Yinghuangia soli]MCF2531179.1 hypothetical protein [Yinghuangia soli]